MARSPEKFGHLLTEAVYKVSLAEQKNLGVVEDELGHTLGRNDRSCIEYWRKGNIPAKIEDVKKLARDLVSRAGLAERSELKEFLESAGYPHSFRLCNELFSASSELAPFIVGPPITHPGKFFGRERALRRVFNVLKRFPLQNIAVIGLPRSGKTSFLHYVERITGTPAAKLRPNQRPDWLPDLAHYRWVFVDFQDVRLRQKERLLPYLLTGLDMAVPEPCDLSRFMEVVSDNLQTPAVILMDEIGAGIASPDLDQTFWESLRSLSANWTDNKLGFVLSAPDIPALLAQEYGNTSPFFNIFGHTVELCRLTEAEARELIAASPRPFRSADIEWILEHSKKWPALLQVLCDARLMTLEEGQTGDAWRAEGLRRINRPPFVHLLEDDCE